MMQEVEEFIAFVRSDEAATLRKAVALIGGIIFLFILWLRRVLGDND